MPRQPDALATSGGLLIPAAAGAQQRALEAEILCAVSRVTGARGGGAKRVITRVQPAVDGLGLKIDADAVPCFLGVSLPVIEDGRVRGIPGLRARQSRDHVELYVPGGSAAVRVHGISRTRWREAVRCRDGDAGVVQLWRDSRDEVDEREAEAVAARATRPVDVLSAILRRFGLFADAAWAEVTASGRSVEIKWIDGARADAVAAVLTESDCRVPGVVLGGRSSFGPLRTVRLRTGRARGGIPAQPEWAWAVLRGESPFTDWPCGVPDLGSGPDPAVWEARVMRAALADQDMCQLLRLLRKLGMPRRQLAALTGQSLPEVIEIVRGGRVPSDEDTAAIVAGPGIPRDYLGQAADTRQCMA